jgi:hypothetical protein
MFSNFRPGPHSHIISAQTSLETPPASSSANNIPTQSHTRSPRARTLQPSTRSGAIRSARRNSRCRHREKETRRFSAAAPAWRRRRGGRPRGSRRRGCLFRVPFQTLLPASYLMKVAGTLLSPCTAFSICPKSTLHAQVTPTRVSAPPSASAQLLHA